MCNYRRSDKEIGHGHHFFSACHLSSFDIVEWYNGGNFLIADRTSVNWIVCRRCSESPHVKGEDVGCAGLGVVTNKPAGEVPKMVQAEGIFRWSLQQKNIGSTWELHVVVLDLLPPHTSSQSANPLEKNELLGVRRWATWNVIGLAHHGSTWWKLLRQVQANGAPDTKVEAWLGEGDLEPQSQMATGSKQCGNSVDFRGIGNS